MRNLNIQNSQELQKKETSLWRKGKNDIKKFYSVNLKNQQILKHFYLVFY